LLPHLDAKFLKYWQWCFCVFELLNYQSGAVAELAEGGGLEK